MHKLKAIKISKTQVHDLRTKLKNRQLEDIDYTLLDDFVQSYLSFQQALAEKNITIAKLRSIFGSKTERISQPLSDREKQQKQKKNGHRKSSDYLNAKVIEVTHASLKRGDTCPKCLKGRLYQLRSGNVIHITGQVPFQVEVYKPERLRCALCGHVFTAKLPREVYEDRCSCTAKATAVMLKYRMGMPFYRQASMQKLLGMPITASEICKMTKDVANILEPVFFGLIKKSAQGHTIHNDDTTARVLELIKENKDSKENKKFRKGIFTSAILSKVDDKVISLYFTGRRHAGENLSAVLDHRDGSRAPPVQSCDALSCNQPGEHKTQISYCLAHCRRKFYALLDFWPELLSTVLEWFREVFHNDKQACEYKFNPSDRLTWHQETSRWSMTKLRIWCYNMFSRRKVEPNSALGNAINYTLKHWEGLTLFLRVKGAPISNNENEQQIKTAVLNRKNSYFFKTLQGANVGDIALSIIDTCSRNGINPWDYLVAVQKYQKEVQRAPENWFPWNYQQHILKTTC